MLKLSIRYVKVSLKSSNEDNGKGNIYVNKPMETTPLLYKRAELDFRSFIQLRGSTIQTFLGNTIHI